MNRTQQWTLTGVGVLAAFALGVLVGGGPPDDPGPATGATEVTPESCLTALDSAEELTHDIVIPLFDAFADTFGAIGQGDFAVIDETTALVTSMTDRTTAIVEDYNAAAEDCRSHA